MYSNEGDLLFTSIPASNETMAAFDWSASLETLLFDCVESFPPIGINKESNVTNTTSVLQHHLNEINSFQLVSDKQVLDHLYKFWHLDSKVEEFQIHLIF